MHQTTTWLPDWHKEKLKKIALERKIPMSRLIAFAIDHELQKEMPFQWDLETTTEYDSKAFAKESTMIKDFLRKSDIGMGLDMLLLFRYLIGVPDKEVFLAAFHNAVKLNGIYGFKPEKKEGMPAMAEDYLYYKVAGVVMKKKISARKRAYEKYLKLQKRFEKEKDL